LELHGLIVTVGNPTKKPTQFFPNIAASDFNQKPALNPASFPPLTWKRSGINLFCEEARNGNDCAAGRWNHRSYNLYSYRFG